MQKNDEIAWLDTPKRLSKPAGDSIPSQSCLEEVLDDYSKIHSRIKVASSVETMDLGFIENCRNRFEVAPRRRANP